MELIYWTRFALAIVAALICTLLKLEGLSGITTGLIAYLASCFLFKYVFTTRSRAVKSTRKVYTTGIGVYLLTWITSWMMLYTLLSP